MPAHVPPGENPNDGRPGDTGTWLVIPYFEGDLGQKGVERPLPPGKGASWLCPSIIVNGKRGGTAFRRGVPISVEIEVANRGAGVLPAAVLVRLWWSDPTLAFAAATQFAQASVMVSPTGIPKRVGVFGVTIPVGASPHVCLLAQVSAPLDGASGVPDSSGDRHWAQLNLVETTAVAADGTLALAVMLGNPHAFAVRSHVSLAPMTQDEANQLGRLRGFDVRSGRGADFDRDGVEATELAPGTARTVDLKLRLGEPLRSGAPDGYVLTQTLSRVGEREIVLVGTLGLLLRPA